MAIQTNKMGTNTTCFLTIISIMAVLFALATISLAIIGFPFKQVNQHIELIMFLGLGICVFSIVIGLLHNNDDTSIETKQNG